MKFKCIDVSNAVWDSVRDGTELTAEELEHISECDSCAAALEDAQAGVPALSCVRPYPDAPDCRVRVWERARVRRPRLVPAWGYACGALAAAAAALTILLWPQDGQVARQAQAPVIGHSHKTPPSGKPGLVRPGGVDRPAHVGKRVAVAEERQRRGTVKSQRQRFHRHRPMPAPRLDRTARARPEPPAPVVVEAPELVEQTSTLACVTYTIGGRPANSYRYSYTITDASTGETTSCSVKREGNNVEVDMQSKPAQPEQKPSKESRTNETILCG